MRRWQGPGPEGEPDFPDPSKTTPPCRTGGTGKGVRVGRLELTRVQVPHELLQCHQHIRVTEVQVSEHLPGPHPPHEEPFVEELLRRRRELDEALERREETTTHDDSQPVQEETSKVSGRREGGDRVEPPEPEAPVAPTEHLPQLPPPPPPQTKGEVREETDGSCACGCPCQSSPSAVSTGVPVGVSVRDRTPGSECVLPGFLLTCPFPGSCPSSTGW